MIETQGLTKRYRSLTAVDRLSLHIPSGEVFGFIGPNGAGKTTTLRMIAALLTPDEGCVRVDGIDPAEQPIEVRRRVGFMPDFFGVYEDTLVWEYLDFFGAAYDIPRSKRRRMIDEVLELVNLSHKRDTPVNGLSRGMKQSLCLAKTLVHDPKVLLLDEPASGLDPRARIEFRELIKELRSMGKTVLVSSHILTELSGFCTSIGIIERGSLIASGTVEDVMAQLRGSTEVAVSFRDRHDEALQSMLEMPFVTHAEREDGLIHVTLAEDEPDAANLIAALVGQGFHITGCETRRSSLEDIFLHVTKGIVG